MITNVYCVVVVEDDKVIRWQVIKCGVEMVELNMLSPFLCWLCVRADYHGIVILFQTEGELQV